MRSSHPHYIQFYPTLRCNRNCPFCFNAGIKTVDDIEVGSFERLASILSAAGVEELDILGGEPTLHSSIFDIVEAACQKGLKVLMSTNGTRVPVMKELKEAFGSAFLLGVSLNTEAIDKELDAFLSLYRPIVKSLYVNRDRREALIKVLTSKGMREYYLIYPDIIAGNTSDSLPFPQFYDGITEIRKTHPDVQPVYCSGFLPDPAYRELNETRCSAGVTKLGIMPDGSVYPCNLFFGIKDFYLGNIYVDGFERIWKSPKLDFFRNFKENCCPIKDCPIHSECHGGCPAHSLKFYGRLDGPEPRCVSGG